MSGKAGSLYGGIQFSSANALSSSSQSLSSIPSTSVKKPDPALAVRAAEPTSSVPDVEIGAPDQAQAAATGKATAGTFLLMQHLQS